MSPPDNVFFSSKVHRLPSLRSLIALCTFAAVAGTYSVQSQVITPAAPVANTVLPSLSGPRWTDLTPGQQAILNPLAPTWESLEPARKRKWLAVALSYPRLSSLEQEKMQSRMAEWAALSPRERAVARLNFAETKKIPPSELAANWDAYQSLSPEERQKLADKARPAPVGAAVAPKQSTTEKVIPVPVTRHTPVNDKNNGTVPPSIDRKTLLPQAPKPVKTSSEPVG